MTWLSLFKNLILDPLVWLVSLVVGLSGVLAGYFYGCHTSIVAFERKQAVAENIELKNNAKVTQQTLINLNEVDKSYAKEKALNANAANTAGIKFNGLRVKSACINTPATSSSSGSNGAGTAEDVGNRKSEVDFTEIEKQVIELGRDYDDAIVKINKLQDIVNIYKDAYSVVLP